MIERVRYTITTMPITGRWRAQIWVDGLPTDKMLFDSYGAAERWATGIVALLVGNWQGTRVTGNCEVGNRRWG